MLHLLISYGANEEGIAITLALMPKLAILSVYEKTECL